MKRTAKYKNHLASAKWQGMRLVALCAAEEFDNWVEWKNG